MKHAHYGHEGCLQSDMAGAQTGSPLWLWPVMVVVESGNDEMVLSCEL